MTEKLCFWHLKCHAFSINYELQWPRINLYFICLQQQNPNWYYTCLHAWFVVWPINHRLGVFGQLIRWVNQWQGSFACKVLIICVSVWEKRLSERVHVFNGRLLVLLQFNNKEHCLFSLDLPTTVVMRKRVKIKSSRITISFVLSLQTFSCTKNDHWWSS